MQREEWNAVYIKRETKPKHLNKKNKPKNLEHIHAKTFQHKSVFKSDLKEETDVVSHSSSGRMLYSREANALFPLVFKHELGTA